MNAKVLSVSDSSRILAESWDFKISKKVAQLTKVIYTLNCRNEDNEERLKWLVQNHENEVRCLRHECAKQIETAASRVKQIEKNKTETLHTIEKDYQSAVIDVRNVFSDKLQLISETLEVTKRTYESELKKAQQKNTAILQEELNKLRESKDLEVSNLVKEYNDRYKSMLAEQMNIRDAMEKDMRAESELQIKTLEEKLAMLKSEFNAQLDSKIISLQSEKANRTLLEKELCSTKQNLKKIEIEQQQLESTNEELRQQLDKMHEKLDYTKNCEERLKKQLEHIAKDKLELAEELKAMQQALQKAQDHAGLLSSDYANVKRDFETVMEQKVRVEENFKKLHKQHEDLQGVTDELKQECTLSSESMQIREFNILQLNLKLQKYMEEIEALKSQNADTIRVLNQTHDEALRRVEQRSHESTMSIVEHHQQEMDQMRRDFEKKLQESADEQQNRDTLLVKQSNRLCENLKSKILEIQKEKDVLQEQKSFLQQERDAIQMKYNALESEFHLYQEEISKQDKKNDSKVSQLQDEIVSLIQKTSTEIDSLRRVLNDQQNQFKHEQQALLCRFEAEKEQIQKDSDRRLQEEKEQHLRYVTALKVCQEDTERRLTLLTQESAREIENLHIEANQALERALSEAEGTQNRLSEELKSLKCELELLRSSGEQDKLQARDEAQHFQEIISDLRTVLLQNEEKHTAILKDFRESANREHTAEIENVRQSHAKEIEKMREDMTTVVVEHKKLLSQLEHAAIEREHEKEQAWCSRINAIQQQAAEERQELVMHHAAEFEHQLEELRRAKDNTISTYREELLSTTKKVQVTMEEVAHLHKKLKESEDTLSNATALIEKERFEASEALAQLRREHLEAMQCVEDSHNKQIELLICEHKRLTNEAFLSFEEERRSHQLLVEQMKASYEELQHKYHYRESRPEDVELINELSRTIYEKDKLLKKTQQDLQTYKLELINREENYNKLFGKSPVVAADTTAQRTPTNLPFIKTTQRGTPKPL